MRNDNGDDIQHEGEIVQGDDDVPRWRRRMDEDENFGYEQLRAITYHIIQEHYKSPCTMSPNQIMSQLVDDDFEGWSLEWERRVSKLSHDGLLDADELKRLFLDILPFGASPALYYMAECPQIYVRKRLKRDTDPTLEDGPFVYEISDIEENIFLRLFQSSKRNFWRGENVSFLGKDTAGKDVMKLVWISSIFPFRRYIKVYCPPGCHIGTIWHKWSWTDGSHLSITSPLNSYTFGKITVQKEYTPSQHHWFDLETRVLCDTKFYGWDPKGLIHGEWLIDAPEPVFGNIFPIFPIGLLTKMMNVAASLIIFEESFKDRLQESILPMSDDYELEMARRLQRKRRRRRLARLH